MFSFGDFTRNKRIYLDHAAATPVRDAVLRAMEPFWQHDFANASAIHTEGVRARAAVTQARETIARLLHIRVPDVYFTASGTESNNLAIMGVIEQKRSEGVEYTDMEIISTGIEHPSVTNTLAHVAQLGVQIHMLDIGTDGLIKQTSLQTLLSSKTVLVSFAYANSEIGVIQPVARIARSVRAFERANNAHIYVHVDAAQAPLYLSCEFDALGVDILTLDAGKCCGPKGVGILAMRHHVRIQPYLFGGGQERGLRPGTENTPLIVGTAMALSIAQREYTERAERVTVVRDEGIRMLTAIKGVVLNGARQERIANNINISIPGIDTEFAVITLDQHGIACSTKSACSGAQGAGSTVVRALYNDQPRARSTIRFTLGEDTTVRDIAHSASVLETHITQMRTAHTKLTGN